MYRLNKRLDKLEKDIARMDETGYGRDPGNNYLSHPARIGKYLKASGPFTPDAAQKIKDYVDKLTVEMPQSGR